MDSYIHRFTHLRTDTSRARWTAATRFRAPHKPLLLLAVLDLIAQDQIRSNAIELNIDGRIAGVCAPLHKP